MIPSIDSQFNRLETRKRSQLVQQRTTHILRIQSLVTRNTGAQVTSRVVKRLEEEEVDQILPQKEQALARNIPDQATITSFSYRGELFDTGQAQTLVRFVEAPGIIAENFPTLPEDFNKISSIPVADDFDITAQIPITFTNTSFISKTGISFLGLRMVGEIDDTILSGNSAGMILTPTFRIVYDFTPIASPAAPLSLTGNPINTGSIAWTWTDNSEEETNFRLRSDSSGLIFERGANINQVPVVHTETNLQPNTLYIRNVAAANSIGFNATPNLSAATLIEVP